MSKQTDLEFFEERIHRPDTPCWNWRSYINRKGYGTWRRDSVNTYVHRVAYELLVGPIPEGLEVHHTCRNRSCVNPAHLELVTHQQNIDEVTGLRTHCKNGHAFTPENTIVRERGRVCRTCHNAASRRANEAKRRKLGMKDMKVECKNGHPRTPENTRVLKGGVSTCVICIREAARRKRRAEGSIPWAERRAAQTHCVHGHEFTPENTYATSTGGRLCRACGRESALRRYYAKKAAS